jgi:hypothetical protein
MRPTQSPTAAEYRVIRWLFGFVFLIAVVVIGWMWVTRTQECVASCRVQGYRGGSLHLNPGSRLNVGTHCECEVSE